MNAQSQVGWKSISFVGLVFDFLFLLLTTLWVLGVSGVWFDLSALAFLSFWGGYEALGRTRTFFLNIHSYLFGFIFLLGVFSIEYSDSFYMYEIDEVSTWSNTFFGALACMYAYFRGAGWVLSFKQREKVKSQANRGYYLFYMLVFCYLIISLVVISYFKPALVLQVDRFFYDKAVLGFWGNVTNLGYYFCLGLGIAFFCSGSRVAFSLFLLTILIFLLKGHKFSNLIEVTFLFVLPYFCVATASALRKKIFIMFSGVALFLVVAVSVNVYLFPSFSPANYLKARLFQEGQLWWAVAKNEDYRKPHLEEGWKEFSSYFSEERLEENFYDIGMYKVMRLTAPHEMVEKKIEKLSRYTRSTQALLLYYFNLPSVFFLMAAFGVAWGGLLRRMYFAVIGFRFFESILLSRLFYILMKAFKDADLYKVFSLEMVVIIFLLAFLSAFKFRVSKAVKVSCPEFPLASR